MKQVGVNFISGTQPVIGGLRKIREKNLKESARKEERLTGRRDMLTEHLPPWARSRSKRLAWRSTRIWNRYSS